MNSLFTFRLNQHNLRNFQELSTEKRNTVNYGLETVTYRAPIIWAKLPSEYKLAGSLTAFKSIGNVKYVLLGYAKDMSHASDIFKQ